MALPDPPFTIGIEEECLLVDRESRDLAREPPDDLLRECESRLGDLVPPEFLRSQIEVGTQVCETVQAARANLAHLRRTVAEVADNYGLAPVAASTHPFAKWHEQAQTDKERHNILAESMQGVARCLLICGMHVHVGIDDDELRIDLLDQVGCLLPHLLALSTSSPFWRGQETGLKSYQLSVFDELPRTGLLERFESYGEYQRHVNVLTRTGLITDASMLWWDARLSARYPTIKMRIPGVCTRLSDAIGIAALFVSIVHMLYRLSRDNQRWRQYAAMLIKENRWRAQRYGYEEGLVRVGRFRKGRGGAVRRPLRGTLRSGPRGRRGPGMQGRSRSQPRHHPLRNQRPPTTNDLWRGY